jgi:hypothetical protein
MEFIKLMMEFTPEEKLLKEQAILGIEVQSVSIPKGYKIFKLKSEAQLIDWLENKVHNVNTAFHKINSKYNGDTERTNWNYNKSQNKRFLETKNLYKKGLYYH